jgi:membrane protease YdiL (CAAX protease family)
VVFIVTIVVFKKCYDFHVYDGKGNDLTKIILLNVATLFCTGLFEEILYRGFILNGLLSH